MKREIKDKHLLLLKTAIDNISNSGANEIRAYTMVRDFCERRGHSLFKSDQPKELIWTEEEQVAREIDNLMNPEGKICRNCRWSNANENQTMTTCGHNIEDFSVTSFCSYWTDVDDPKVKEYHEKRKEFLKVKLKQKTAKEEEDAQQVTVSFRKKTMAIIFTTTALSQEEFEKEISLAEIRINKSKLIRANIVNFSFVSDKNKHD